MRYNTHTDIHTNTGIFTNLRNYRLIKSIFFIREINKLLKIGILFVKFFPFSFPQNKHLVFHLIKYISVFLLFAIGFPL